jgi:hypothetical protein
MKTIKTTLFALLLVTGLSVAAQAQKDQKPPPKEKPPVVKPAPPKPPPDNSNKGHHGGDAFVVWKHESNAA